MRGREGVYADTAGLPTCLRTFLHTSHSIPAPRSLAQHAARCADAESTDAGADADTDTDTDADGTSHEKTAARHRDRGGTSELLQRPSLALAATAHPVRRGNSWTTHAWGAKGGNGRTTAALGAEEGAELAAASLRERYLCRYRRERWDV